MNTPALGVPVGPLTISYFALIVVVALAIAAIISIRKAYHRDESPGMVLDALTAGLVGAIVLGRLFYILNPPPSVSAIYNRAWYLGHPLDMQVGPLALWAGGLGSAGVMLGAGLAAALALWQSRAELCRWADILTPGVQALFIAVPWANVAGQSLFGPPTDLPWGLPLARRVPQFADMTAFPASTRFQPTPIYLSLWAALVALGVWWIARRFAEHLQSGDRLAITLGLMAPGLLVGDLLRADASPSLLGAGVTGMQLLAILILVSAIVYGVMRRQGGQHAAEAAG
jgi:phosphatidylglycerol:prolipoprotein diacylglycerol transferase